MNLSDDRVYRDYGLRFFMNDEELMDDNNIISIKKEIILETIKAIETKNHLIGDGYEIVDIKLEIVEDYLLLRKIVDIKIKTLESLDIDLIMSGFKIDNELLEQINNY